MKESSNVIVSTNTSKNVPKMQEIDEQEAYKQEVHKQPVLLTQQVIDFLKERYDFRYNLLTGRNRIPTIRTTRHSFLPHRQARTEYFLSGNSQRRYQLLGQGSSKIYLFYPSGKLPPFPALYERTTCLGRNRSVEALSEASIQHSSMDKKLHTWMLGLAAQWLGVNQTQANSVAPILISEEQGLHKSTFCRMLMPPQLARYYSDNLKLTAQGNPERLLAEMGLLNMDEFDKFGAQKMPLLKNLMQMSSLNICKAYQKNFRSLPRIASFIGTSNRTDLLCDPTGSRRFICIEAEHDIDCTGIEHSQIYAQLKEELLAGARHWFNKEEEHALQCHNMAYYHVNPIEDIVRNTYAPATLNESDCLSLSAAIIHQELKKRFPAALRSCTPIQLAQIFTATGISRQHTRLGNVYLVKRVKDSKE